jgi:hypothetical protein
MYNMKVNEKSLVLGRGKHKAIKLNFMRDIGSINRNPPKSTLFLISNELNILPTDLKFHDILNIASSRLDRHTMINCVRTKGISKQ